MNTPINTSNLYKMKIMPSEHSFLTYVCYYYSYNKEDVTMNFGINNVKYSLERLWFNSLLT